MSAPTDGPSAKPVLIAFAVVTVSVAAWVLSLAEGTTLLFMLALTPVYAAVVIAIPLVVGAIVAHVQGRPPWPIPLLPTRWATDRRAFAALAAFAALFTIAREGGFAPEFVLGFNAFRANNDTNASHSWSQSSTSLGTEPQRMAGRPVICHLQCSGPGDVCAEVVAALRCDNHNDAAVEPLGAVFVSGLVSVDDPACFVPLYKHNVITFTAELSLSLNTERTNASVGLSVQGATEQTATGPMSCLAYRTLAGRQIAPRLAAALNAAVQAN